ncbi:hypothetical protein GX441_03525 [bacterium]|nr:hypothetical protein [bacterium]
MKYKVWFDSENQLVMANVTAALEKEEAEALMNGIKEILKEKKATKGIMDLSNAEAFEKIGKEVREVYKEYARSLALDCAAVIVTSPVIRMLARVVLSSLGMTMTAKFVKSYEEALEWIKRQ